MDVLKLIPSLNLQLRILSPLRYVVQIISRVFTHILYFLECARGCGMCKLPSAGKYSFQILLTFVTDTTMGCWLAGALEDPAVLGTWTEPDKLFKLELSELFAGLLFPRPRYQLFL